MKSNRLYWEGILNKNNYLIKCPFLNMDISLKILCNFTRRYQEESEICENSSFDSLLKTKKIGDKQIYVYDKEFNIKKKFDIQSYTSLENIIDNFQKNIKIYPFMLNHQIIFNYASLIVEADIRNMVLYNQIVCDVNYISNGKKNRDYRYGTLKDSILYFGPIFRIGNNIEEIFNSFQAKIKIN